jgi:hypothetical protein
VLSPFSPSRTGGGGASRSEDPIIDQDFDVNQYLIFDLENQPVLDIIFPSSPNF